MGAPLLKTKNDTAQRILDSSLELFARHGYAGVSVRDIAERAGVKKAAVFYHYDNKAQLLERLLDTYYTSYQEALRGAAQKEGTLAERLHQLLDANLDFIEENLDYVRLVQVEVAHEGENLESIRNGITLLFNAAAKVLEGQLPEHGPLALRHLFVTFSGMINTYFLQARALEPIWDGNPISVAKLRERREHLHWALDALTSALFRN
jgi:AcrR family transcriptional regulator